MKNDKQLQKIMDIIPYLLIGKHLHIYTNTYHDGTVIVTNYDIGLSVVNPKHIDKIAFLLQELSEIDILKYHKTSVKFLNIIKNEADALYVYDNEIYMEGLDKYSKVDIDTTIRTLKMHDNFNFDDALTIQEAEINTDSKDIDYTKIYKDNIKLDGTAFTQLESYSEHMWTPYMQYLNKFKVYYHNDHLRVIPPHSDIYDLYNAYRLTDKDAKNHLVPFFELSKHNGYIYLYNRKVAQYVKNIPVYQLLFDFIKLRFARNVFAYSRYNIISKAVKNKDKYKFITGNLKNVVGLFTHPSNIPFTNLLIWNGAEYMLGYYQIYIKILSTKTGKKYFKYIRNIYNTAYPSSLFYQSLINNSQNANDVIHNNIDFIYGKYKDKLSLIVV